MGEKMLWPLLSRSERHSEPECVGTDGILADRAAVKLAAPGLSQGCVVWYPSPDDEQA